MKNYVHLVFVLLLGTLFQKSVLAQVPEISPQIGHNFGITCSKLHPNGRWLATGGGDNLIKLWDIYENRLIRTFAGHQGSVMSIDFHPSPDSLYMISTAEEDNLLIIWDLKTGEKKQVFKAPRNFLIESVSFDDQSDGKLFYLFGFKAFKKLRSSDGFDFMSTTLPASMVDGDANASEIDKNDDMQLYGLDVLMYSGRLRYLKGAGKIALRYYHTLYLVNEKEEVDTLDCGSQIVSHDYCVAANRIAIATAKDYQIWDLKTKKVIYRIPLKVKGPQIFISRDGDRIYYKETESLARVVSISENKYLLNINDPDYNYAGFIQNDRYLLLAGSQGHPRVFNIARAVERPFGTYNNAFENLSLSPDKGQLLVADHNHQITVFNRSTLKIDQTIKNFSANVSSMVFSPDSALLATGGFDMMLKIWKTGSYSLLKSILITDPDNNVLPNSQFEISSLDFSPDSKFVYLGILCKMATVKKATYVYKVDVSSGLVVAKSGGFDSWIGKIVCDKKSGIVVAYAIDDLRLMDGKKLGKIKKAKADVTFFDNFEISPKGDKLIATAWGKVFVWEFPSMNLVNSFEYDLGYSWSLKILNDSIIAAAGGFDDYRQYFINYKNGKTLSKLNGHSNRVMSSELDGNILITASYDSRILFWDIEKKQLLATLMIMPDNEDYILIDEVGNYMATKGALDKISFRNGVQLYEVNRFDLELHRPEILLQKVGRPNTELIELYQKLYLKRKANTQYQPIWNPKDIPLLERALIPYEVNTPSISLQMKATKALSLISRINIWVDGVPVFGPDGFVLNTPVIALDTAFEIPLKKGDNVIEYSIINTGDMESERPRTEVFASFTKELNDLYIVCLSVSKYADSKYNLKYAVKDGRDIAGQLSKGIPQYSALWGKYSNSFNRIYLDTLFDEEANLKNLADIKARLLKAKPQDRVIFYLSGHGLLDKNLDFWFATHDIDFKNPSVNGLSYSYIEEMLNETPAREKLLLMDACHSGQTDRSEVALEENSPVKSGRGVSTFTYRGAEVEDTDAPNLKASFELMQEIFSDLNQGSGTQVISAAAGNSYALESDVWNNGVFTYCLLNGLKNKKADLNKDGMLYLSELNEFVSEEVSLLTSGRQKPTSRSWNKWADFKLN